MRLQRLPGGRRQRRCRRRGRRSAHARLRRAVTTSAASVPFASDRAAAFSTACVSCRALAAMRSSSSLPRLDERLGALALQPRRQRASSMPSRGNSASTASASPPSFGHGAPHLAVLGEGEQRLLRHRVDRVGRRQCLDVERVGRVPGPWCRCWPRAAAAAARRRRRGAASAARRAARGRPCRCAARPRCRAGCAGRGATLSLTATSQRLTKSEATEATFGSRPAAMRRSMPRR